MPDHFFDPSTVSPAPHSPNGQRPAPQPRQDDTGFNALWSLLNWSIFIDYFAYVADRNYLDTEPQVRFQKHRTKHPVWYGIAIVIDTILKVVTVAIVLIVIVSLALKVIK